MRVIVLYQKCIVMTELKAFKKIMKNHWVPQLRTGGFYSFEFRVKHIKINKNTRLEEYLIDIEVRNFKVDKRTPGRYLDVTGKKPNRVHIKLVNHTIRIYAYYRLNLYLKGFGIINKTNDYSINKIYYI